MITWKGSYAALRRPVESRSKGVLVKVVLLTLVFLLAGCSDDEPPRESEVFDDLTGAIDKAEEVEKKVMEQKERLDEALRDAEQPPDEQDP